jgi:hypothetical protein
MTDDIAMVVMVRVELNRGSRGERGRGDVPEVVRVSRGDPP